MLADRAVANHIFSKWDLVLERFACPRRSRIHGESGDSRVVRDRTTSMERIALVGFDNAWLPWHFIHEQGNSVTVLQTEFVIFAYKIFL